MFFISSFFSLNEIDIGVPREMLEVEDTVAKAMICYYIDELEDIVGFSNDLNLKRRRLTNLINWLAYLVVDEA